MKLLLVTGQLAQDSVRKYANKGNVKSEVIALSVPVAALLSPQYIARELRGRNLGGFSMVMVPGLVSGDLSIVEETIGIKSVKGPKYAADLPFVIGMLGKVELSKTLSADVLLKEELRRRALKEIEGIDRRREELLKKPGNMLIGNLPIGKDFPPRVMAEIVDAPKLSDDEIVKKARYYSSSGADIIDVGMLAGESRPSDAERAIKIVRSVVSCPVSIDTMDPREAKSAVLAGADLILSVDGGNVEEMAPFALDTPVIIIPTNHRRGLFPKDPLERVDLLEENIERAKNLGIKGIIADLILDPMISPGFTASIVAYYEFRRRNPYTPLLMGVGNVTELMDADTMGANALLAGASVELGASILLTTEVSDKVRGSVRELFFASRMMLLARMRSSVPKDMGLDLLVMRDRKLREETYDHSVEGVTQVLHAKKADVKVYDSKGCFKIVLDRDEDRIVLLHYPKYDLQQPSMIIKGREAEAIYRTIIDLGLVTLHDHAAYLGSELQKAQIALDTGKGYHQDTSLFIPSSQPSRKDEA